MKSIILFLGFLFAAVSMNAATHTVTSNADAGMGSLRAIINDALPEDTIVFAPNVLTITLTGDEIKVTNSLTIIGGSGNSRVVLRGGNNSRIFNVQATLKANNLVFEGGNAANGGAVYIDKDCGFTAENCLFRSNTADGSGGAVYVDNGGFYSTNCTFSSNMAVSFNGGAVYVNQGTFMLENCTFTSNNAFSFNGGAIYVIDGNLDVKNCTFTTNSSGASGGAIYVIGNSDIENSVFMGNNTNNTGGALYVRGDFIVRRSSFRGNSATNSAGAIHLRDANFIAINCEFSENQSSTNASAILCERNNVLIAANSTFSKNDASSGGYAIYTNNNNNKTYLYHCTFDENNAEEGGAIFNGDATLNSLYSYNCIYAGSGEEPIIGEVSTAGTNLIEPSRFPIFGARTLIEGYIVPFETAKTANRLTANIMAPEDMTPTIIISWLETDQAGNVRPTTGNVTHGSVEAGLIVTLRSNLEEATLTGAGVHESNSNVTIEASFDDGGYVFKHWINTNDEILFTDNPLQITLVRDTILIAIFEEDDSEFNIIVNASMGGSANLQKQESSVIITATPDTCYNFIHWIDDAENIISTENPFEFVAVSDTTLTAIFEIKKFEITIAASENGVVIPDGTFEYDCEQTITITAEPDEDYIFVYWIDAGGNEISTENPLDVIIKSDTNLTAIFEFDGILEYDIYDISIVPNPADKEFNIIFDNPDEQGISIELLDISGRNILNIFEGFAASGPQTYKLESPLPSGTYLIKFLINNKPVIRKVIVK